MTPASRRRMHEPDRVIYVRCSRSLHEWVEAEARYRGCSINQLIVDLLEQDQRQQLDEPKVVADL